MLEAKELCQPKGFRECLVGKAVLRSIHGTLKNFLSVTFLPFTHTIYTIITHKSVKKPFREKNPI